MRLNNLSARLIVNKWLVDSGQQPLGAELSYQEFATELRKVTALGCEPAPFADRLDACRYIRMAAQGIRGKARKPF